MSSGEVRKVSPDDIQMVQNLIEQCLPYYLTLKQVIDILYQEQKIEPSFTELVWQKLEEQNQEFFKAYHLRLMVKDQITEFNNLLKRQAALVHQVGPSSVASQSLPNGSHMPSMHQNTSHYAPENTQQPITSLRMGFSGPSIHSGVHRGVDISARARQVDVVLAQNSNLGMNGLAIKTEPGYLDNSRFVYGGGPAIGGASVSSFGSMGSDSHQLNGTLLDDNSSFELLGPISQNIDLPDLTAEFNNDKSRFASEYQWHNRDDFLDSHGSTAEHQGENKRLDDIPENLGFQDFGRNS